MSLLKVHEITRRFGETTAVDRLSFSVEPGEIFGLVGPDGAGKTTTLRILVGVLDMDEGTAELDGFSVRKDPEKVREHVGYMPQQYGSLYGDLTVDENLRFFADMYYVPKAEREKRLKELYHFSRLEPYASRPADKLSGGMQKKLALSCCMIHTPKVLLLDEPTTGVDPVSRRELWEILYRFSDRGIAMVVSTPYMDEAERCHRVGLIHEGRFLALDTPNRIIDNHDESVYELLGGDPLAGRAALDNQPWLSDVYPFGDALHVVLPAKSGKDEKDRILSTLAEKGITGELTQVRPTFEDVFMAKIREVGQ